MKIEIKNPRYVLFLLSFLGFFASLELCYIYYNANFIPNAEASFCSINDIIDCDAVARTAFSTFLGIPNSFYGVGFYLFIIFLSVFPFKKFEFFKNFKNPVSYIFTLSSLAFIGSLVLWIISSIIIHKACLLCYLLYGVNIFLLIFSKPGKSFLEHYKDSFNDFVNIISEKKWLSIVAISAFVGILALVTANITKVFEPPVNNDLQKFDMPASDGNTAKPKGNLLGAKNAKLVIHEYTDFECPFCSISNSMLARLVNEVHGVRIEHHDFPLNTTCNPYVKASIHQNSCLAIYYARAAKKQDKYWDYINLLFDNQQNLSEANLIKLAKSINLNIDQLKKDAHSTEVKESLKSDLERAHSLNITATPTYVIGIKKYEGIMPYAQLKDMIDKDVK